MSEDTAHTIFAFVAITSIAAGCLAAFGVGIALLVVGSLLLAGVIYARVFAPLPVDEEPGVGFVEMGENETERIVNKIREAHR